MSKSGRPLKYAHFLEELEDEEVYTPSSIVQVGEQAGFFRDEGLDERERYNIRLRVRHTMARLSTNHEFPMEGDGWVYLRGQPPLRGWKGERWKSVLKLGLENREKAQLRLER